MDALIIALVLIAAALWLAWRAFATFADWEWRQTHKPQRSRFLL